MLGAEYQRMLMSIWDQAYKIGVVMRLPQCWSTIEGLMVRKSIAYHDDAHRMQKFKWCMDIIPEDLRLIELLPEEDEIVVCNRHNIPIRSSGLVDRPCNCLRDLWNRLYYPREVPSGVFGWQMKRIYKTYNKM